MTGTLFSPVARELVHAAAKHSGLAAPASVRYLPEQIAASLRYGPQIGMLSLMGCIKSRLRNLIKWRR
eukprot:3526839-Lingulodinium_polyedra.AAC.1